MMRSEKERVFEKFNEELRKEHSLVQKIDYEINAFDSSDIGSKQKFTVD